MFIKSTGPYIPDYLLNVYVNDRRCKCGTLHT